MSIDLGDLGPTKKKVIILYSGGADSRLMLELALKMEKSPFCILMNYGQAHIKELDFAQEQLTKLHFPHQIITIKGFNVDSGLTGSIIQNQYEGVHSHHVPMRNTIFLSLAAGIAESKNIDTVWLGADFDDRINLFPDCYQEYIIKINELLEVAGSMKIKVEAPLLGMTKEMVLSLLKSYNVDEKEIFSGYGEFA